MKRIGWILACVLLVMVFSKNILASTANLEFSKEETNGTAQSKVTRIKLVSGLPSANPDIKASRSILHYLFGWKDEQDIASKESRTFGFKRFQLLMPMLYKMGVMMTMLMVLTAISAKGLLVGLILLVLKLSAFLSKFHSGWHQHGTHQVWPPHPIHVHVHSGLPYAHAHPYNDWELMSGPGSEDHYYYKG